MHLALRYMELRLELYNEKDELAGYALLELHVDELHVSWIYVHPHERGRGVGSKLIKMATDYARRRNFSKVTGFIDTYDGDVKARIRFFKKRGEVSYVNGSLRFTIDTRPSPFP